jgi:hypothetical protein
MKRKVDITHLKSELPRGYGSEIARKLKITPQAVSIAMKGRNPMHPAIQEAIKIRDRHRVQLDRIKNSIKK